MSGRAGAHSRRLKRTAVADLTGGELVARVLAREGVGAIFTLCGGHVLPIYDACLRHGIRVVDVRHEQAAAHAADAWARLTRALGVAVVVPGPGVTDAVTGVANAFAARSPLLLIGGASPLGLKGRGALQEMEQVALLRPITKGAWAVPEPRLIPEYLARAIDVALTGQPGPVFVEIAVDLLMSTVDERDAPLPVPGARGRPAPSPAAVERVAALLANAERPAIVAGSGVYWDGGWAALARLAERAALPVFTNGMGRGCLPHDHPMAFQLARGLALSEADVVLVLGTPLDFRLGYGQAPVLGDGAQVVMVDAEAATSVETARSPRGSPRTSAGPWRPCTRRCRPGSRPGRRAGVAGCATRRMPSARSRLPSRRPTARPSATTVWQPSWPPSWTIAPAWLPTGATS